MHSTRRLGSCMNCGEEREMAAFGLCFKCYRREDRAKDRMFAAVDRRNPGIRREHKKLVPGIHRGSWRGLAIWGFRRVMCSRFAGL